MRLGCYRAARPSRPARRGLPGHRDQLPGANFPRPGVLTESPISAGAAVYLFLYTRGGSGYSLYSSAKAAVVNLTLALADEWTADGVRVNCVNPERTATPMRSKAFGAEPEGSLLASETVAETALDVLISGWTGHIVDVRRESGLASPVDASIAADI